MRATDLREFRRTEQGVDLDNLNKMVRAVQELLGTAYDGDDFSVVSGSGGKHVRLNMNPYMKDDFHLTWLDSKKVRVGQGSCYVPFQNPDASLPPSVCDTILTNTSVDPYTDVNLYPYKYMEIYLKVVLAVHTNGNKAVVVSIESFGNDTQWYRPADSRLYSPPYTMQITLNIPLYMFIADTGSAGAWDNFRLVHDLRYGVRITFDVQGLLAADGGYVPFWTPTGIGTTLAFPGANTITFVNGVATAST